jgi:hypothetical protein
MLRNEYSLISALEEVLETWIKIGGYSYRHEARGLEHSFVIHHDMSRKWSLYLRQLFRFIYEDFELSRVDFDIDENAISLESIQTDHFEGEEEAEKRNERNDKDPTSVSS